MYRTISVIAAAAALTAAGVAQADTTIRLEPTPVRAMP